MARELTQRVLLAVHDAKLCFSLETALQEAAFEVFVANDNQNAVRLAKKEKPDFILIDRMLPKIGGVRLCRSIRAEESLAETQIIVLSDHLDFSDRMRILDAGADDCLVKPFGMEEMLARIATLQRRLPRGQLQQVLKAGDIEMVPDQWAVYVAGEPINLTEKEYRLLQELLAVKGRVLTRETLLERVWGRQAIKIESRTLDVHMSRLRNKLGASAANIITVRNVGYRINFSPEWLNP